MRPGVNGRVELSPFALSDWLADLVPPLRKHRHRYPGVFAPNHNHRRAVTALTTGNVGKRRDATTGGHAVGGHNIVGCYDSSEKPARRQPPAERSEPRFARGGLLDTTGMPSTAGTLDCKPPYRVALIEDQPATPRPHPIGSKQRHPRQ